MWYSFPVNALRLPFHYGWVIVAAGMLGVFACLGLGRFALGMLLPSMSGPLGLTYSQMGFIGTGNFVGYLVSVLVSGSLASRYGPRRIIGIALLVVGASMMLVGLARGFVWVLILYTVTGMGSGAANVPLMALVPAWFSRTRRGRAAGFIVIGSGFAIIVAGKLIPFINMYGGPEGWRMGWLALGGLVLLSAAVCVALLRNRPEDVGLRPLGIRDAPGRSFAPGPGVHRMGITYHLGAIYFLFGYTYVIYATFVVTSMVREWGLPEAEAGGLWAAVGLLSLLSGPVFGTLSDRLGRRAGFALVFLLHALSYLLAASRPEGAALWLSIAAFGLSAWSIPSIMAAAVGDYVGAARAPQAFGLVTFIFALGQISGPAVAGVLADAAGGFSTSYLMAGVLALAAAALSVLLRKPGESEAPPPPGRRDEGRLSSANKL
jgi:MFS family permease